MDELASPAPGSPLASGPLTAGLVAGRQPGGGTTAGEPATAAPAGEAASAAPAAPVTRPVRRPGRLWYWLALLALCAGIAWPLLGVRTTDMKVRALQRVPLPAGGRVVLPHAGSYVINYEAHGASEGTVPPFRVQARPLTPGLTVTLLGNSSGTFYSFGTAEGIAVLNLKVSRAGAVFLAGRGAPAVPGGSELAVGPPLPGFMLAVMPGIGLMFLGIGGIIAVATLRSRGALMRVRYPSLSP